jgi:hypothetical protein
MDRLGVVAVAQAPRELEPHKSPHAVPEDCKWAIKEPFDGTLEGMDERLQPRERRLADSGAMARVLNGHYLEARAEPALPATKDRGARA